MLDSGLTLKDEVEFAAHLSQAPLRVGLSHFLQTLQAPRRVMKVGNGLVESRLWQVGQLGLKLAERAPHAAGLLAGFQAVEIESGIDPVVHSPGLLLRVLQQGLAAFGQDHPQIAALTVGQMAYLGFQVARNPQDVVHHPVGQGEDVGVEPLQHPVGTSFILNQKGVVDVASPQGRDGPHFAADGKTTADVLYRVHSRSG